MDGISAALVDRQVMLLLDEDQEPDREALASTLGKFKMQIRDMQKAPSLPF